MNLSALLKTPLGRGIAIISGVVMLIIVLHAGIEMYEQKSIKPFVIEVIGRVAGADNYLYDRITHLDNNPDEIYYQAKLQKIQSQYGSDPNRLQMEMINAQSKWEQFKYFLSKVWIWFDLIATFFFIFSTLMLFYYIFNSFNSSSPITSFIIALIVYSLLNINFTAITYDHRMHDNKTFLELDGAEQAMLLNPIKGIWSFATHFKFLIGQAYKSIIVPIENIQMQNDSMGTIAKTLV